jgi:RNA polymerase sigma-70 factor (sigma-E family)
MSVLGVHEDLRAAYEEHYVSLLRLCTLLAGDRDMAEDIVQDAFVKLSPRIAEVSPEQLRPYLRKTVVNVWRNRLRKLIRERRASARSVATSIGDATSPEDRTALRLAVLRLPQRQRACLVLRYYEDLSERDVASLLGCSIGTVKSQTSHALARLRKEFGGER